MSEKFDYAYAFTKKWEGGWSNVKDDPGGATNYGITLDSLRDFARRDPVFLKAAGVQVPVSVKILRDMSPAQARDIFQRFYWDVYKTGEFPVKTAAFVFDCTVNHGYTNAVKLVQRGANAASLASLSVDCEMGPKTKAALLGANDAPAFLRACVDAREAFYRGQVAKNSKKQKFLKGWLNRAQDQRKYLGLA